MLVKFCRGSPLKLNFRSRWLFGRSAFLLVLEVVELVVEVVNQHDLVAASSRVTWVLLGESRVEVCHVELVLQLWYDWGLVLEILQLGEVDVGEPRVFLDRLRVSDVTETVVRVLLQKLGQERAYTVD